MRVGDPMKGVFQGLDIAASGLKAELQRSEIVASNLANMHDTGNETDLPYQRRAVVFEEALDQVMSLDGVKGGRDTAAGVNVREVYRDNSDFRHFFDPNHPDANEAGWVLGSNVDMFKEMVDLVIIERSYQANLAAMQTYRTMLQNTVTNIGRS